MKYLVLFLVLISCVSKQDSKEQWKEVICPNCQGIGKVKKSSGSRFLLGLLTLGPGALCETGECAMCRGKGVVKQRILNDSIEYDRKNIKFNE